MDFMHYGVKGMKWGVRRYQPYSTTGRRKSGKSGTEIGDAARKRNHKYLDKNGNLTKEGVDEVLKHVRRKQRDIEGTSKAKKEAGIVTGSDVDVIKKGSVMQRITGSEENIDEKRKYMSITPEDNQAYGEVSDMLDFSGPDVYYDTYETKRDIKVANEKAVKKYVLSKYGNVKFKDLAKDADKGKEVVKQMGEVKLSDLYMDTTDSRIEWYNKKTDNIIEIDDDNYRYNEKLGHDSNLGFSYNYYKAGKFATRSILQKLSKDSKMHEDMLNFFKKAGVDAMVDLEDRNIGFQYPLIVLNPKDSVTRTSHK